MALQTDLKFSRDLANWLNALGFKRIDDNSLQKLRLCPRSHQNMWYHLMKHVRPVEEVDLIKKNILISEIKKDQKIYQKKLKAIVNTPEGFEVYRQWANIQEEIKTKKRQQEETLRDIRSLQIKIGIKEHQIRLANECIEESNRKRTLLQMKIEQQNKELDKMQDVLETCQILNRESCLMKSNEECDQQISSFVEEIENIYHVKYVVKNEVAFENDQLWIKAFELMTQVPAYKIMDYVTEMLVSEIAKLKEELKSFTDLKASSYSSSSDEDPAYLQKTLVDIYLDYETKKKETNNLNTEIDALLPQIADNIIKKFSLSAEAHEQIMMYLDAKCTIAYNEENTSQLMMERKIDSEELNRSRIENFVSMLERRIEQMDQLIKEKLVMISEFIRIIVDAESAKKVEDARKEIVDTIGQFVKWEDVDGLLNLSGTLQKEIALFLKTPLKNDRVSKTKPMPSSIRYFPFNRQEHLLPLRLFVQNMHLVAHENILLAKSESLIRQLREHKRDEKLSMSLKERKEKNAIELKNELESTKDEVRKAEDALSFVKKCIKLFLNDKESLNKFLLVRDPSYVEDFPKYERIMREFSNEMTNLFSGTVLSSDFESIFNSFV